MKTAIAVAWMIIFLTPALAQQPIRNIATFGIHTVAPAAFQKIHFGVNASDYFHIGDKTLVGASVLGHYVPQRIKVHAGAGLMQIINIENGRTHYFKSDAGIGISTQGSDVGEEPTDSGFDTLSSYGFSIQAAYGVRTGVVDISLFGLYQNLPGNKFWLGLQTGFFF